MSNEHNVETEVQRILALKRHEQPPPSFFAGFSDRVIEGIQTAGPAPRPTLRQRLSAEFYGVPIYVCAAGVAVCGLLAAGLIISLRVGPAKPERVAAGSGANANAALVENEPSHTLVPPRRQPAVDDNPRTPADPTRQDLPAIRASFGVGSGEKK